jgi:hypothetical protein
MRHRCAAEGHWIPVRLACVISDIEQVKNAKKSFTFRWMLRPDIEQVKNAKKSFTFRWMLRQITLADSGKGQ